MPLIPALRELTLSYAASEGEWALPPLPPLPHLEALLMAHCYCRGRLPVSLRRLLLRSLGGSNAWDPDLESANRLAKQLDDFAASFEGLPSLEHLVLEHQAFLQSWSLPTALVRAIDSLPRLRSLHFLSCQLCLTPRVGCLTRLEEFSLTDVEHPQFPQQLAKLLRCRHIDLSGASFMREGDVEGVLSRLAAACAEASCSGITRHLWLKWMNGLAAKAVVRRLLAAGNLPGLQVWDDERAILPPAFKPRARDIMTCSDFRRPDVR